MSNYLNLSQELQERIVDDRKNNWVNPYAFQNENVVRKYTNHDIANIWRPAFVRDCEKVMHNPYYNRYSDKTQVFSLLRNDDISRRAQHVQLVSRIARNIGAALGLNLDLIEAISLGHDIGHTPFGHAGERELDKLYYANTGRHFNHNIQSARVFTTIFPVNMSLQTLDGIICHNGELELKEYRPSPYSDFSEFEAKMEKTYTDTSAIEKLIPATLEGCVMRVSDIIAYLGKDRQDAMKIGLLDNDDIFGDENIGKGNAEIINNITVNIIENSYGKDYIAMDDAFFQALKAGKKKNGKLIYGNEKINQVFDDHIFPMFDQVYEKLLSDYKSNNKDSVVYKHHMAYVDSYAKHYQDRVKYDQEEANAIIVDYMASMTDDYFIDLYQMLFPDSKHKVDYIGYFDEIK